MLHLASTSASIALLDLSLSRPIPSAVPTVYTHANLDTTLFNLWRIHPFYTNNYIMAACERGGMFTLEDISGGGSGSGGVGTVAFVSVYFDFG